MVKKNTKKCKGDEEPVMLTFCCQCGKVLGQGCRDGKKENYGDQKKRRFHGTCKKKADDNYSFHMSCIFDEEKGNFYDWTQHYNYVNKAYVKTKTNDITRKEEHKKHMDAKRFAEKKQREFDKKHGFNQW